MYPLSVEYPFMKIPPPDHQFVFDVYTVHEPLSTETDNGSCIRTFVWKFQ